MGEVDGARVEGIGVSEGKEDVIGDLGGTVAADTLLLGGRAESSVSSGYAVAICEEPERR